MPMVLNIIYVHVHACSTYIRTCICTHTVYIGTCNIMYNIL